MREDPPASQRCVHCNEPYSQESYDGGRCLAVSKEGNPCLHMITTEPPPLKLIMPGFEQPLAVVIAPRGMADKWLELIKANHGAEAIEKLDFVEERNMGHFDLGGMAMHGEGVARVVAGGIAWTCAHRQLEYVIERLRRESEQEDTSKVDLGRHVYLRGHWWNTLLPLDLATEVADAFEAYATENKDKIEAEWDDYAKFGEEMKGTAGVKSREQMREEGVALPDGKVYDPKDIPNLRDEMGGK